MLTKDRIRRSIKGRKIIIFDSTKQPNGKNTYRFTTVDNYNKSVMDTKCCFKVLNCNNVEQAYSAIMNQGAEICAYNDWIR